MYEARSLVRNLIRKQRQDRALNDEISGYVQLLTQQKIEAGMDAGEAGRAALIETEGLEQVKKKVRDVRRGHSLEILMRDLQFAVRTLRKAPVFSAAVSLVFALGIGSTTLIFAIVESVLLQGPPFPQADRLITEVVLKGERLVVLDLALI